MGKGKKTSINDYGESLDFEDENPEEDGFVEGDIDLKKYNISASFNFAGVTTMADTPTTAQKQHSAAVTDIRAAEQHPIKVEEQCSEISPKEPVLKQLLSSNSAPEAQAETKESKSDVLTDNNKQHTQAYGITPPVGGEYFEVNRTFKFRRSTVRLLNQLKAEHPDENVYLSSILDEAIRYYYRHILGENEAEYERK